MYTELWKIKKYLFDFALLNKMTFVAIFLCKYVTVYCVGIYIYIIYPKINLVNAILVSFDVFLIFISVATAHIFHIKKNTKNVHWSEPRNKI